MRALRLDLPAWASGKRCLLIAPDELTAEAVFGECVAAGERVEIVMPNRTMMSHPMHLHGHVFQVVGIDGRRFSGAMRDTVLVPPRTTVTVAFDADNPGRWAFHCHNLYHLEAGMMTTLRYTNIG